MNRVFFHSCETMPELAEENVHCVVTSPPYYGLRDYGVEGQIGREATVREYIEHLVRVFREVKRVLRKDGTLWLNLGDSYASKPLGSWNDSRFPKLKPKDLIGVPWRVAFALQADGWWLRSDIIWAKPACMPESVTDRPTRSHEYLFLLARSARYYYDAAAIRENLTQSSISRLSQDIESQNGSFKAHGGAKINGPMKAVRRSDKQAGHSRRHAGFNDRWDHMTAAEQQAFGSNARDVWKIATDPYPEAHFATMPRELVRRCILAGSPKDGLILDPFIGSGTVAEVAQGCGRSWVGYELNPAYEALIAKRVGLFYALEQGAQEVTPQP